MNENGMAPIRDTIAPPPVKEAKFKRKQVEAGIKLILEGMGVDLEHEDFKDTPARVARAYEEICGGLFATEQKAEGIFGKKFKSPYQGMIVVGPISVAGLCPHHLLPVTMSAVLAYIPGESGQCVGLSKIPRAVKLYAQRPAKQEDVSNDIVEAFNKYVNPAGVALWLKGSHGCMTVRGITQPHCGAITQDVRGLFETDVGVKTEFEHKLTNFFLQRY
jgi:GTP cyclohydrolase IA